MALPDFAPGGMENFGAITYRETLLLLDPRTMTDEEAEAAGARVGAALRVPPDG